MTWDRNKADAFVAKWFLDHKWGESEAADWLAYALVALDKSQDEAFRAKLTLDRVRRSLDEDG